MDLLGTSSDKGKKKPVRKPRNPMSRAIGKKIAPSSEEQKKLEELRAKLSQERQVQKKRKAELKAAQTGQRRIAAPLQKLQKLLQQ